MTTNALRRGASNRAPKQMIQHRFTWFTVVLVAFFTSGCTSKREFELMKLNADEAALVSKIGFDSQICEIVKGHTDTTLEQLVAVDLELNQSAVDGLSIRVDRERARQIANDLEPILSPNGYHAFTSEIATPLETSNEIVVLKTDDPFALLRIRSANGSNYGVTTDKLIETLREWDDRCDFRIVGAGHDWVELAFSSLPSDVCAFAEQVYQLCPDSVEQGTALMNESDDPELFAAARRLCPKLSDDMETKLRAQQEQFEKLDIPPELKALAQKLSTPTDMGIRVLAYQLKESQALHLWWD